MMSDETPMRASQEPVAIGRIPTGVPHLDEIMGGGIPELSVTVLAGLAGAGKTTLAQQVLFHNASDEHPVIYFTTLGEPPMKLVRYQQQFSFFDVGKVGRSMHIVDLSRASGEGAAATLAAIQEAVERLSPRLIAIDSLHALYEQPQGALSRRRFVHDLAELLAPWQCTALLINEYAEEQMNVGPEFTVADNILFMSQEVMHNSVVRRLRVIKMRGQAPQPGRHAFRITSNGLQVFPRFPDVTGGQPHLGKEPRAGFGVIGLDEMMRGGIPRGQTCMVAGSSGSGKTLLALHFAVHGTRVQERCVMVTFEESPAEHAAKMAAFGWDLPALERDGSLSMLYLRPVDLSIDEVIANVQEAVAKIGAKRVVINSISGMEIALPQTERQELRDGLYRMTVNLTARGTTVLLTTEVPEMMGELRISSEGASFLADNIILLRYIEIAAELRRAVAVIKMRTSAHDNSLREYRIGKDGIVVDKPLKDYSGLLTGIPTLSAVLEPRPFTTGLPQKDESLMTTLLALKQATPEELADALGVAVDETTTVLDRLVDTGYVVKSTRAGRRTYRVALITPAARPPERRRT